MKAFFLFITFYLILSNHISSQNPLYFSKIDSLFTWRNSTKPLMDSAYLSLPMVEYSKYKIHIRISFGSQILDLFSKDSETFSGELTNIITEYQSVEDNGFNSNAEYQKVYEKLKINNDKSSKIAMLIMQSGQETISDSSLMEWQTGYIHCAGLFFEFNVNGNYHSQKFECPFSQNDSIPSKSIVVKNYDYIKEELKLDTLYTNFINALPAGKTYSSGYLFMYKLTNKESIHTSKYVPHHEYMQSINDTLNQYLSAALSKVFTAISHFECDDLFFIKFSKHGKLIQVTRRTPFSKNWDMNKKFLCDNNIKKDVKKIRVEFIYPTRKYWRTVRLFDNKAIVSQ